VFSVIQIIHYANAQNDSILRMKITGKWHLTVIRGDTIVLIKLGQMLQAGGNAFKG
jgi:hypothetical protein